MIQEITEIRNRYDATLTVEMIGVQADSMCQVFNVHVACTRECVIFDNPTGNLVVVLALHLRLDLAGKMSSCTIRRSDCFFLTVSWPLGMSDH